MEIFKNSFRGGSAELKNLPDCSMYDTFILFISHRSTWIKNLNME